jgi:hypothetical protein
MRCELPVAVIEFRSKLRKTHVARDRGPMQIGGMGRVTAALQLSNPRDPSLAPIEVPALADTGSVFLRIPEHVRLQLKLEALEQRPHGRRERRKPEHRHGHL